MIDAATWQFHWKHQRAKKATEPLLTITEEGLTLGKTVLAPLKPDGALLIDEARILALLSVAYHHCVSDELIKSIRHASAAHKRGDKTIALMHLALTGLHAIDAQEAPLRLFKAEKILDAGMKPRDFLRLFKSAFAGAMKSNPYHLGPGPGGGQFTTEALDGSSVGSPKGSYKPSAPVDLKHPPVAVRPKTDNASPKTDSYKDKPYNPSDDAIDSDPIGGILIPAAIIATLPQGIIAEIMAAGGRMISTIRGATAIEGATSAVEEATTTATSATTESTPIPATTLPKPEGIPENWIEKPSDSGGGIKYVDPENSGNYVRIMPGNPTSPHPNSQVPNVRWLSDGQYLDVDGSPVPKKTPEAHIPLTEFKFNPKVYK